MTMVLPEDNLSYIFNSILTKGRKDNTYKFALARFLIDYVYHRLEYTYIQTKLKNNESEVIEFATIAKSFLKYYWHQICKYKIRQNYNMDRLPLVVQIIQDIFGKEYIPTRFEDIDGEKKARAEKEITRKCFTEVIHRFHTITGDVGGTGTEVFYTYNKNSISVKPEALRFFSENYTFLYKAIILEWAKFLERVNRGLPMLISKIEREEVFRNSLKKPYKILREHFETCFYCGNLLSSDRKMIQVDHFIPWSYIFEDEIWNLVLACRCCNSKKNRSLPPVEFVERIIDRNEKYFNKINGLEKSLLRLDTEMEWKKAINRHYQNCKDYGFTVIDLNVS